MKVLRDIISVCVVAFFMFPIAWTAWDSLKPVDAVYNKDGIVFWNFDFTMANYAFVLGEWADLFDGRPAMMSSMIVGLGAAGLALAIALPAAFALWRLAPRVRLTCSGIVWFFWMLPPIVMIWPISRIYHATGLFDTHIGLVIAEASLHLPFAILVMSSFMSDVPREMSEAATIDGAGEWTVFWSIMLPAIRGSSLTTFMLLFLFCWTEFNLSLFLTSFLRLVPVQIANMSSADGGSTMALSTMALAPCFIVLLFVQKNLARGLTLGMQRD
jgi:multiple sugar transport system permease protein